MDLDKLQKELAEDEGCKYEIYNDHLGYATFGIGHLVTDSDLEYGQEIGTEVSKERVDECFKADIEITIKDCNILYSNFNDIPEEAQLILANMMFNLGRPRLSKFLKLKAAVDDEDWMEASVQMMDSKWAKQVPNRAKRLCERMEKLSWLFKQ
jgi:lysozyme|tara:strand:- start:838 stop:1296 length:459 start_codon:yes stop_codon:yes gene_type:complete